MIGAVVGAIAGGISSYMAIDKVLQSTVTDYEAHKNENLNQ